MCIHFFIRTLWRISWNGWWSPGLYMRGLSASESWIFWNFWSFPAQIYKSLFFYCWSIYIVSSLWKEMERVTVQTLYASIWSFTQAHKNTYMTQMSKSFGASIFKKNVVNKSPGLYISPGDLILALETCEFQNLSWLWLETYGQNLRSWGHP